MKEYLGIDSWNTLTVFELIFKGFSSVISEWILEELFEAIFGKLDVLVVELLKILGGIHKKIIGIVYWEISQ